METQNAARRRRLPVIIRRACKTHRKKKPEATRVPDAPGDRVSARSATRTSCRRRRGQCQRACRTLTGCAFAKAAARQPSRLVGVMRMLVINNLGYDLFHAI